MNAIVLRGDARALPLPDASVDLIVTSPPYFGLRSYTDGGEHYGGQIGSEATPQEWVAALVECTREWMRVLKPSGSMFVNLGDKFAGAAGPGTRLQGNHHPKHNDDPQPRGTTMRGMPPKSLLGLPWRYALACTDQLGLILRRDIVWAKPNGLPESVTDRCRSSHEYLFHLVRQPRYYAAVDEIREPQAEAWRSTGRSENRGTKAVNGGANQGFGLAGVTPREYNLLGKLPGSVWNIPSQPLTVPAHLGVDHFAAFPMELPRRCVLGWSPPGICVACGEGRRPVVDKTLDLDHMQRNIRVGFIDGTEPFGNRRGVNAAVKPTGSTVATITGYACACTPHTDHPGTGSSGERYGNAIDAGHRLSFPDGPGPPSRLSTRPAAGGGREYHFDGWTPPPTRPSVVVDPFGGTGTTALVASMLGRTGVSVDRSADYTRLARWRTTDPGERAKAMQVPKPPPIPDGMEALF